MPRGEPQKKLVYGVLWPITLNPAQVEMTCIKHGGQWKLTNGDMAGEGLFFHYKRLQQLLWPEDAHHRWSDLILKEILQNRITSIMGAKDTGKTHCALAKFALTDYFCFPQETLVMLTSTDIRGLELRVWGDLKNLYQKAKERAPWLPGNLIDSKHAIATDNLQFGEARDMRRGCVCLPMMTAGGSWQGIGKMVGLKQKRRRLLSDECFVAGSMVDIPGGKKPIEKIIPSDVVISANGPARVMAVSRRTANSFVAIKTQDGRELFCTTEHPFFTNHGWKKAVDLSQDQYLISPHEAMQIMRSTDKKCHVLRQELLREMEAYTGCDCMERRQVLERGVGKNERGQVQDAPRKTGNGRSVEAAAVGKQLHEESRHSGKGKPSSESVWLGTSHSRRQWDRPNESRENALGDFPPTRKIQPSGKDREEARQRLPNVLQDRRGVSRLEIRYRSRWFFAPNDFSEGTGREKDKSLSGSWVDGIAIYQPEDSGGHAECEGGIEVYNLKVDGHPSYSVNGFLVHNCQFLKPSFLESLANLNSGDFKAVFVGNPIGEGDPLDKVSEPKDGWGTEGEISKTSVWENKFIGGRTINLVGTDSPNFDQSQDPEPKYPFLINQKSIDNVVAFYGKDSLQYYSQCLGIRKPGLNARRVINKQLCKKFGAFNEAIWMDTKQTDVYAIDAAYGGVGGDRCAGIRVSFGKDFENKLVMKVYEPDIIPVMVREDKSSEDQISEFVKAKCEGVGIPAEHVFFDATGRGSLGTSFARVWSAYVNPVEFGGKATPRPVSANLYIYDEELKQKRLKRCDEHYSKFVTELWFTTRYIIEGAQMRELPESVMDEGCRREWKMVRGDKIEVETKPEMKERVNISPDLYDAFVTACEGARRLGFIIQKLQSLAEPEKGQTWKNVLRDRAKQIRQGHELNYAA